MATVGQLNVSLDAKIGQFVAKLKKATGELDKFGNKADGTGKKTSKAFSSIRKHVDGLKSGIQTGLKVAFAALSASVALSVKQFAAFERQAVRVGAISGELQRFGDTGVASISQEMLKLSKTTEFTATQVGEAFGFMAQSGMKFNQITAAAPGVLQLASAAAMDVGSAADIATNVLKGFGLEISQLGNVNDVLIKTATNANTSVAQLGDAMKYVGPVASSAGVDITEVSAALGILGDAGLQGEMGGTALRGMLSKLLSPSKEASRVLKKLGITSGDLAKDLRTEGGLAKVLEKLGPLAGQTGAIFKIFGQRAGPGMSVLLSAGVDKLKEFNEELKEAGGTAKEIADAQLNTLDGKIKILVSNIEALSIKFGDSLEPAIKSVIGVLGDLVEKFSQVLTFISFGTAGDVEGQQYVDQLNMIADRTERLSKANKRLKESLKKLNEIRERALEEAKEGTPVEQIESIIAGMAKARGMPQITGASSLLKTMNVTESAIKANQAAMKNLGNVSKKVVGTMSSGKPADKLKQTKGVVDDLSLEFDEVKRTVDEINLDRLRTMVGLIAGLPSALSTFGPGVSLLGLSSLDIDIEAGKISKAANDSLREENEARETLIDLIKKESDSLFKSSEKFDGFSTAIDDFISKEMKIVSSTAKMDDPALSQEAREALLRSTEKQIISQLRAIHSTQDLAEALEFVEEVTGAMGIETESLREKVGDVSFENLQADFGPQGSELLSKQIFKDLKGLGFDSDEITKGLSVELASEIGKAFSLEAPSIGRMIGAAVGGSMKKTAIGAQVGERAQEVAIKAGKGAADVASGVASFVTGAISTGVSMVGSGLMMVVDFLIDFFSDLKPFTDLVRIAATAMGMLLERFNPLEKVLFPLAGLFSVFLGVFQPFIDGFVNVLVQSRDEIFNFAKSMTLTIGNVVLALAHGFNVIIQGIQLLAPSIAALVDVNNAVVSALVEITKSIVQVGRDIDRAGLFTEGFDAIDAALDGYAGAQESAGDLVNSLLQDLGQVDTDMISQALSMIAGLTIDEAERLALLLRDANETMNESLTNVPQGFKVALERFRAIDPALGSPTAGQGFGDGDALTQGLFIENIYLQVADPEDFADQMSRIAQTRNLQQGGGLTAAQLPIGGSF